MAGVPEAAAPWFGIGFNVFGSLVKESWLNDCVKPELSSFAVLAAGDVGPCRGDNDPCMKDDILT